MVEELIYEARRDEALRVRAAYARQAEWEQYRKIERLEKALVAARARVRGLLLPEPA
jgi:hypothetical protein